MDLITDCEQMGKDFVADRFVRQNGYMQLRSIVSEVEQITLQHFDNWLLPPGVIVRRLLEDERIMPLPDHTNFVFNLKTQTCYIQLPLEVPRDSKSQKPRVPLVSAIHTHKAKGSFS